MRHFFSYCPFFNELDSYKSDIKWGGLEEGITRVKAKIGQLVDAGQRNKLALVYFGRGRTLFEREHEKRLELVAEITKEVKEVDICQLKKYVNKPLHMNESMPNGGCVIVISARLNNFLDERKLSRVFVPERRWEKSPGKTIAASIITTMHPPGFKTAERNLVKYEGAEEDPEEVIITMNHLKTELHIIEKYEAAARRRAARWMTKKMHAEAASSKKHRACCGSCFKTNRQGTKRCWHCEGPHLKINCYKLNGSK